MQASTGIQRISEVDESLCKRIFVSTYDDTIRHLTGYKIQRATCLQQYKALVMDQMKATEAKPRIVDIEKYSPEST